MENDSLLVRRPVFFRGFPVSIFFLCLLGIPSGLFVLLDSKVDSQDGSGLIVISYFIAIGLWFFVTLGKLFELYVTARMAQITITDQETVLKYGDIFRRTKKYSIKMSIILMSPSSLSTKSWMSDQSRLHQKQNPRLKSQWTVSRTHFRLKSWSNRYGNSFISDSL